MEDRFSNEDARAHHYLSRQTAGPLSAILEETLLSPHLSNIIAMPNSGLDNMLDFDQLDNLARLYRLFIKVPAGLITVKKALKDSIMRRGAAMNTTEDFDMEVDEGDAADGDPKVKGKGKPYAPTNIDVATKWVEGVLALKDKFDSIWRIAFLYDRTIETAYNEVCVLIVLSVYND